MKIINCSKIVETAYEEDLNIIDNAQIGLHTFFCQECAQKILVYKSARALLKQNFVIPSNNINMEDSIMAKINSVNPVKPEEETHAIQGVLSTRGWVITGLLIIISFASAFFGMDFKNVASETGTSFMLPVGILFGIVLTTYCAFFIGSHLKEFTERFL